MRRLLPMLALVGVMATGGAAAAFAQDNGKGSSQAASNSQAGTKSQAGTNSQAGTKSQAQGQANEKPQSTQTLSSSPGGGQTQAEKTSSGNGANKPGPPYGVPNGGGDSGNGNSTNNNSNKPDAGTVGNADDKNPPGQQPGGGDPNHGYECDLNQGVGQTNPAHSGCKPPEEEQPGNPTPPNEEAIRQQQLAQNQLVQRRNAVLGEEKAAKQPQPEHAKSPGENVSRKLSLPTTHRELPFTGLGLLFMALLGGAMIAIGRGLESVVPGDARR